jgi:hypothetical protein
MVGTNDSLYIISNCPDGKGAFFRIDENGLGHKVIWKFDGEVYFPYSLMVYDDIIYGTTRFSANGGGAIFRYSLQDYSFEIVKDFDSQIVQDIEIKYVIDDVLWLTSQYSSEDKGSIFTIKTDGTDFKKIFNDTNSEDGQNPVDFVFHEGKIYIAYFNGGGIPYPDGTGSFTESGCIIRINEDGTGYEKIIVGQDGVGTQPHSLIIRENKLFGLFAYSGSDYSKGGQFFQSNLDGSSYTSLGALDNRAISKMLSTDNLIYGVSSYEVFGINPFDGEVRIFDDITSNSDFGYDVVANPVILNGHVYIATQQGGPNSGGTILKWSNIAPEVNEPIFESSLKSTSKEIDLNKLFTDPEGDSLTFKLEYDENLVSIIKEPNGTLRLTPIVSGQVDIKITASDGWTGYSSTTISDVLTSISTVKEESKVFLYPNPVHSTLKLARSNIESIEIFGLDGKIYASFNNPTNEINISTLISGIYFVRIKVDGKSYAQKISKQ